MNFTICNLIVHPFFTSDLNLFFLMPTSSFAFLGFSQCNQSFSSSTNFDVFVALPIGNGRVVRELLTQVFDDGQYTHQECQNGHHTDFLSGLCVIRKLVGGMLVGMFHVIVVIFTGLVVGQDFVGVGGGGEDARRLFWVFGLFVGVVNFSK